MRVFSKWVSSLKSGQYRNARYVIGANAFVLREAMICRNSESESFFEESGILFLIGRFSGKNCYVGSFRDIADWIRVENTQREIWVCPLEFCQKWDEIYCACGYANADDIFLRQNGVVKFLLSVLKAWEYLLGVSQENFTLLVKCCPFALFSGNTANGLGSSCLFRKQPGGF